MVGEVTSIILPTKRDEVHAMWPGSPQAVTFSDLASGLSKQGKLDAAIVAIRRAIAFDPDHPIWLSHLGAFLWDVGQYVEAEVVLRRAIELEPKYAPARGNFGSVLAALGKIDEAREHFEEAMRLEPEFPNYRWNYALSLLDVGLWKEAWYHYEFRFDRDEGRMYPKLRWPKWTGQDLSGKTLWIQSEQGVGDRIMFCRYIHWVKKKYPTCHIKFAYNALGLPDVANLLWGYRDIVEFIPNGVPQPTKGVDYGVYLMSLPGMYGTTPENVYPDPGYILKQALLHKAEASIPPPLLPSARVGVIWSGSPAMKRNIERSVPFEVMLRLMEIPNVVLYSLQFDNTDLYDFGANNFITDMAYHMRPMGFMGTAAAMLNLDLIITACTSTAHLAGALGVPTWTLLCENPYWVWGREGNTTPWYPNMKLFRQKTMYDWAPVFDEVRSELVDFANATAQKNEQTAQAAA